MPSEVLKKLLECGVHFGHQTRRWNPKMQRFIFGQRSGIHIIDLEKTEQQLGLAREFAKTVAAKGGRVLFVGTKKQARDVMAAEAARAGMPYITNRWLGGLLTNFETIRKSLDKLFQIEKMEADGVFQNLKKKEVAQILKTKEKILRDLGGIREMLSLPEAIFVIDTKREETAVKEATRLGIPLIGLLDTNADPDVIQYPVPGNDDALKSIRYIATVVADGIIEGRRVFLETESLRIRKSDKAEEKGKTVEAVVSDVPADAAAAE